ncbi:chaperone protein dnaJ 72 [Carica papaya]|uniref:chaperone protein dnaJ 72 n=1 Tax=Carica papaya TaxID=3649 RepID=UPI000B8CA672|nr:chaperone protein dnaJ 72 [Carica papaya]
MDHYKVLGLGRKATKEEIKEAFRRMAVKYHPDKHSHSPQSVRDDALLRFKQVSEAYEVLIDDSKRALYNSHMHASASSYGYASNHSYRSDYGYGYGYSQSRGSSTAGFRSAYASNSPNLIDVVLRFLTTRQFFLSCAFAGALFGGFVVLDKSGDALWKIHNPGKSFEEAMESIEKAKDRRDKT